MITLQLTEVQAKMLLESAKSFQEVDKDTHEEHKYTNTLPMSATYAIDGTAVKNWKRIISKLKKGIKNGGLDSNNTKNNPLETVPKGDPSCGRPQPGDEVSGAW